LHKTCDVIKMAFGEDSLSHTQVFEWFHCFREGKTFVESNTKFEAGQKCCSQVSSIKTVLCIEFILEGHTINKDYYLQVLWHLHDTVHHK
jgi:hypothetical protein